jgi:hypothetical protein
VHGYVHIKLSKYCHLLWQALTQRFRLFQSWETQREDPWYSYVRERERVGIMERNTYILPRAEILRALLGTKGSTRCPRTRWRRRWRHVEDGGSGRWLGGSSGGVKVVAPRALCGLEAVAAAASGGGGKLFHRVSTIPPPLLFFLHNYGVLAYWAESSQFHLSRPCNSYSFQCYE